MRLKNHPGSQPTYEELKHGVMVEGFNLPLGSQPTYEELKQREKGDWKIGQEVLSLPMRN